MSGPLVVAYVWQHLRRLSDSVQAVSSISAIAHLMERYVGLLTAQVSPLPPSRSLLFPCFATPNQPSCTQWKLNGGECVMNQHSIVPPGLALVSTPSKAGLTHITPWEIHDDSEKGVEDLEPCNQYKDDHTVRNTTGRGCVAASTCVDKVSAWRCLSLWVRHTPPRNT